MRYLLSFIILLLGGNVALAQTPGPGPLPPLWTPGPSNSLSYDIGGITLPHGVLGGSLGPGTINVQNGFYVQGTLINPGPIVNNSIWGNPTSATALPQAISVPNCVSALYWITNTGFGCNTAINAATLGGATFSAPGAIGSTTPGSGSFTNLTVTGTASLNALAISSINATPIGNVSPASGNFTTLQAGASTLGSTTVNGSAPITNITTARFSTSGSSTYVPTSSKLQYAVIECWGAGAGSGGVTNTNTGTGGGGAGGYTRVVATAAQIGSSQAVVVGSGGLAGTSAGSNGGNGNISSVGTLCVANGGNASLGSVTNDTGGIGGAGAGPGSTSVTAQILASGGDGGSGFGVNASGFPCLGGLGGASSLGSGGAGGYMGIGHGQGRPGSVPGSGGGGACGNNGAVPGATGANGLVLITEYNSS